MSNVKISVYDSFKADFLSKWSNRYNKEIAKWFRSETNFEVSYDELGNPIFTKK